MAEPAVTSRRLIQNSLFNLSAHVATGVIAFFLVPILVSGLGKDGYGVWALVGSIFAYASTLQLGLASAVNRYVPRFLAKDDRQGVARVISSAVLFFLAVGIVLFMLALLLHGKFAAWFSIPTDLALESSTLVLVIGSLLAVAMPLQVFAPVITGLQRFDIYSLGRVIPIVLRAVLVIWLLSVGLGLVAVGVIYGLCELVIVSTYLFYTLKLLGPSYVSFKAVSYQLLREMLAYGINTFLYFTAAVMLYKGSEIIIGVFLTPTDVAMFAIASAPLLMLSQLLEAFTAAIKPAVSDLDARHDTVRVREISFLGQKYLLLLLFPATSFLVLMGRNFLELWVGEEFGDVGVLLALLAIGHFARLSQHSNFLVLVGKGEHKLFGILAISMSASVLVLGVVAVGVLNLGLIGMVAANVIPMVIIYGVILPICYNRRMAIRLGESLRSVVRPALLASLPAMSLLAIWAAVSPPDSWLELGLVVVAVLAVWGITTWYVGIGETERQRLRRLLFPSNPRSETDRTC